MNTYLITLPCPPSIRNYRRAADSFESLLTNQARRDSHMTPRPPCGAHPGIPLPFLPEMAGSGLACRILNEKSEKRRSAFFYSRKSSAKKSSASNFHIHHSFSVTSQTPASRLFFFGARAKERKFITTEKARAKERIFLYSVGNKSIGFPKIKITN